MLVNIARFKSQAVKTAISPTVQKRTSGTFLSVEEFCIHHAIALNAFGRRG
jgi:hypothetical protein